jgi:type IV secretory pathway TraG/TraD family ATPase VirD4
VAVYVQFGDRNAVADAINAANWQARLDLGRDQVRSGQFSPEAFAQQEKETEATVARLRGRQSGIDRLTFEYAYYRARTEPSYRMTALSQPQGSQGPGEGFNPLLAIAYVVAGFIALCVVWVFVALNKPVPMSKPETPKEPQSSGNFGTADYAKPRASIPDPLYIFNGVFFGKSSAPGMEKTPFARHQMAPICSLPEHHTLIVAQTGTGKGTRVLVPTLLRYGMGSAFVIDPTGANTAITARTRASPPLNQKVHIINPWNEKAKIFEQMGFVSAKFNPLDILDRHDENCVANAKALALAICPIERGAREVYWTNSAARLLSAVLLWLTNQEGLPRIDDRSKTEVKTLARVQDIVTRSRADLRDAFLKPMAKSPAFDGAIRESAASFIDLADVTYSGVISNLNTATEFLTDPQIKKNTASSSFSMEELVSSATTVYLVVPPRRAKAQRTWLRLLISAAMQTFKNRQGPVTQRCLFLIDELPALGTLDDLPEDVATVRNYGVDLCLVVQGLGQLKEHYGDSWETIVNNCAYKWFCNIGDPHSARYLSQILGRKTIRTSNQSEGMSAGPNGASTNQGTSTSETGRDLLMPDEAMRLGRDVAILINPDDKPHYLRPVDYWDLPEAFEAYQRYYPHLYWQPPLKWDRNPYRAAQKLPAQTPVTSAGGGPDLPQIWD